MKQFFRSGLGRAALGAGAVVAMLGTYFTLSPHQACVRAQQEILLKGPYSLVPDRAGFAADRACAKNHDVPQPPRWGLAG